jgi:hypothetical protein
MGNSNILQSTICEITHATDFLIIETILKPDCQENSFFVLRRDHEKFNELAQKLIVGHCFRISYSFYDINTWIPMSFIYQIDDLDAYNQLVATVSKITDSGNYWEVSFYNSVYKFLLSKHKNMITNKTYKIKFLKIYNQNSYIISEFATL